MNLIVPFRLIAGSLCFLYLILPLLFVTSVREVLTLAPVPPADFAVGTIYSICTFLIILLVPKDIVIRSDALKMGQGVARAIAWLTILLSAYFFANALRGLETLIYFDKVAAHAAYEELNATYGLRLKYNVLLCLFLMTSLKAGMRGWGALFFVAPILFEVVFSKHNYATHLLTYLFILTWNSRVSRKAVLISFAAMVGTLLTVRFIFYSDFQNDPVQSLAAMLGEFTISWQSIPSALSYSGSTYTGPTEWYSDIISNAAGLEIGLAGNPVAEAIFYFGDWAGLGVVGGALLFTLLARASARNFAAGIALLVVTYYMRDCFRTGWSLGLSVFAKSVVIFSVITLGLMAIHYLGSRLSPRASLPHHS
ncbi:hypothetical protein FUT87_02090 [Mitsuaria sp. TWR114]|uniref:hypothetical protein n=1 Tax=Mitsuaria sp. TWR114 TaxID=2601731 RepID=UPI0011BF58E3|nr:hypothetical protein [Mitsuaria sp. TWR114]TXD99726.1 hypothetical protein FUT87_02090 [Mitsuaria sp. TWR114]